MLKLAVVGRDVSASDSPEIHSFIARRLGFEIRYDRVSIKEEEFINRAEDLFSSYDGFNVTIPYKLSILPYLNKVEGDALAFGAVNTVKTDTRTGYNTDGSGFMLMLDAEGIGVNGRSVLVLGAGGAGRSAAKKLKDAGASVQIYNRTFAKAQGVAQEFGVTAVGEVGTEERYLIVNATGVGMHETVGVSPVPRETLARCEVAVDLIYRPIKSRFLLLAEELGKKAVNGAAMLFYQAYFSDCVYFGVSPDRAQAEALYAGYLRLSENL